ncbi:MAG TPA: SAM-dependent methyltransferase [Firmicutes bacterium]|nr:SAM-dependent methyltransferase [Bacillota bacterium]
MTKTLAYYNENAIVYSQNTLDIAFDTKRDMLLKYLKPQAHILDLGCGSGRDSKAFLEKGYTVTAVDGSVELCKLASEAIGQVVVCKRFEQITDIEYYDAVWACASLLHLPSAELSDILIKVSAAIKPGGYFYVSFKYGNFEGEREGRYFTDFTLETFTEFITPLSDLILVESQVSEDVMQGRENLKWLNVVMRKQG